ncbi:MAG: aldo/keto reductase [Acidobacteria bacterium]|nr:aldo/keto reductase [Acidobacteriota bacterium]
MKISRREFLHTAAGLGIASLLPGCSVNSSGQTSQAVQSGQTTSSTAIPSRFIPGTNESLPVVGLGSTKAVLEIPDKGPDEMRAIIQTMVDNGGEVIDTSFREERIDRPFGQILQDGRWKDGLFVATKINTVGKQAGIEQMQQTERLFNRRPADLIQVESLRDADVHLESLREWKANGRTRYIGVTAGSIRDFERIEAYMKNVPLDFIQVNYSLPESEAEQRVLPAAKDLGIAVLIRSPFMNGEWFTITSDKQLPGWAAEIECTNWAQVGLKYILAHPAVTCVLTETTNPVHLIENMHSSLGRMPDDELLRRMKSEVSSMI